MDWTSVCSPLITMLFSTDDEISNTGKNSLTILLEQNENVVTGLLQASFIDRASVILDNQSSSSSQSSAILDNQSSSSSISSSSSQTSATIISRSPIAVMNILVVLESILTVSVIKTNKSVKLIKALEKVQLYGSTTAIKQKARMLLSMFQQEMKDIVLDQTNKDDILALYSLEQRLRESERQRIEFEEKLKISEQKLQFAEQSKIEIELNMRDQIRKKVLAEQQKEQSEKDLRDEQRRRIESEENMQYFQVRMREYEQKCGKSEQLSKEQGQQIEDLLMSLKNAQQINADLKQSDWIQMKNDLEIVERGTDVQKEEIKQKKIKICQKIISIFIGKKNIEGMKLAIESGIIEALLYLLMTNPLENINLFHIFSFYIFTYTSNAINNLIFSQNPYPALIRLLDHPDTLIVNRTIVSISNLLLSGSNTNEATAPHPHFTAVQAQDGIQKIFALFQRNLSYYSRNSTAECICYLFGQQEIQEQEIKIQIISHLKSNLKSNDSKIILSAKDALNKLAMNTANLAEIMKDVNLEMIQANLRNNLEGTEEQQTQIKKQQEYDCWIIVSILQNRKDDEFRLQIINSGIVDTLLNIILTRDLILITQPIIEVFYVLTNPSNDEIKQLLYSKNPYPALIRLFDHDNQKIIYASVVSISNILITGVKQTPSNQPHPHFTVIQQCDGTRKLFRLFKQSGTEKNIRDIAAQCIGNIFKAQAILDKQMRTEIIAYLKVLINDSNEQTKKAAKYALRSLAQNEGFWDKLKSYQ